MDFEDRQYFETMVVQDHILTPVLTQKNINWEVLIDKVD